MARARCYNLSMSEELARDKKDKKLAPLEERAVREGLSRRELLEKIHSRQVFAGEHPVSKREPAGRQLLLPDLRQKVAPPQEGVRPDKVKGRKAVERALKAIHPEAVAIARGVEGARDPVALETAVKKYLEYRTRQTPFVARLAWLDADPRDIEQFKACVPQLEELLSKSPVPVVAEESAREESPQTPVPVDTSASEDRRPNVEPPSPPRSRGETRERLPRHASGDGEGEPHGDSWAEDREDTRKVFGQKSGRGKFTRPDGRPAPRTRVELPLEERRVGDPQQEKNAREARIQATVNRIHERDEAGEPRDRIIDEELGRLTDAGERDEATVRLVSMEDLRTVLKGSPPSPEPEAGAGTEAAETDAATDSSQPASLTLKDANRIARGEPAGTIEGRRYWLGPSGEAIVEDGAREGGRGSRVPGKMRYVVKEGGFHPLSFETGKDTDGLFWDDGEWKEMTRGEYRKELRKRENEKEEEPASESEQVAAGAASPAQPERAPRNNILSFERRVQRDEAMKQKRFERRTAFVSSLSQELTPNVISSFASSSPALQQILRGSSVVEISRSLQEQLRDMTQKDSRQIDVLSRSHEAATRERGRAWARLNREAASLQKRFRIDKDDYDRILSTTDTNVRRLFLRDAMRLSPGGWLLNGVTFGLYKRLRAWELERQSRKLRNRFGDIDRIYQRKIGGLLGGLFSRRSRTTAIRNAA